MDSEIVFGKLTSILHEQGMPDKITDDQVAIAAFKYAKNHLDGLVDYINDRHPYQFEMKLKLGTNAVEELLILRNTLLGNGMPDTIGNEQVVTAVFNFAIQNLGEVVDYLDDDSPIVSEHKEELREFCISK